ncbi:hypothetical protein BLOT_001024 [Blomia tropicalis]|nr:hypothetical protein BLOT_001024 [Blomia tropicalis]
MKKEPPTNTKNLSLTQKCSTNPRFVGSDHPNRMLDHQRTITLFNFTSISMTLSFGHHQFTYSFK